MTPTQTTASDWIESIAAKANVSVEAVQAVLDRHGIEPQAALPRRRRLHARAIHLEGVKEGTEADGPFKFDWAGLGPGLWAVLSDKNSRGKSSLLNILQAALRCEFPGNIKPDVWRWLGRIEVHFEINAVPYRVLVTKEPGREDSAGGRGILSRLDGGAWFDLFDGPLGSDLARTAEDTFMEELAFTKFHAYNKVAGAGRSHGWPAIATSFFVNGPGKAVFGEVTVDGMPLRLLQLFMGLPWISTYSAASTALKKVQAEKKELPGASDHTKRRLTERLNAVEQELKGARSRARPGSDRNRLRQSLMRHDASLVALQTRIDDGRAQVAALKQQLAVASTSLAEAKRTLQQVKDENAAGYVFRQLRPVCCPSCDAGIDQRRYEAVDADESCALCGMVQPEPDDSEDTRIDDLLADVRDAEQTVARLNAELKAAERRLREAQEERTTTLKAVEAIQGELSSDEDSGLELEIRGLEAQATQLRELMAEEQPTAAGADDEPVLKEAEKATKALFDTMQRDILKEVSEELTKLSQRFGVKNVETMEWSPNNVLTIIQGKTKTTFSELAPGEKLRVRIAAALAVIEVSRRRHFGRHPGLLVLDSPAAQEMTAADFASLMASVQDALNEAEDIQIIVGAVARPELLDVVPFGQRRHAEGDATLF
jgi:energy-coupling factor transporter ATP-binding protein EcfA2